MRAGFEVTFLLTQTALGWGGARKGVADVVEFGGRGEQIDGEDIKADGDGGAVGFGQEIEVGGGHLAEHVLLGAVDGGFGWGEGLIAGGGEGFDLEDDQGGAVPGDEVEVAGQAARAPATGDDGVAETAEMEEGRVFATLTGEEMWGLGLDSGVRVAGGEQGGSAIGAGAEGGVKAAF